MIAGLLAAFTLRFASRWAEAGYWAVVVGGVCWLTLPAGFGWDGSVVPGPTTSGEMVAAANASLWAIAGGFGCGLVMASMLMLGKIEATFSNAPTTSERKPSVEPDLEAALEAQADGRLPESFELISALLEHKPEYRAALIAMWEVALELGREADASNAMLRVVRDEVRRNAPSAVGHWLDLASRGLHGDAEPALLIHIALMLREAGQPIEALSALKRALENSADSDSAELAARVARASQSLDRNFTEAAAWRALGSVDLAYKDRQNLEALLGELYRESPKPPSEDGLCDDAGAAAYPAAPALSAWIRTFAPKTPCFNGKIPNSRTSLVCLARSRSLPRPLVPESKAPPNRSIRFGPLPSIWRFHRENFESCARSRASWPTTAS